MWVIGPFALLAELDNRKQHVNFQVRPFFQVTDGYFIYTNSEKF